MNCVFFTSKTIMWAASMLFTLPKKGDLTMLKNWRGIQMGEYINSWYDRILCNRIKLWMNIDEFQTAYQKGKSCNTQLFTFRIIMELTKFRNKRMFISFIDLEKAFDNVRRSTMLKVLSKLGMGSTMLNALKNLYSVTIVHLNGVGKFISTTGIHDRVHLLQFIFL